MTTISRVIAPEYLSVYLAGYRDVDVPLDLDNRGITSTRNCVVIGCLYWNDGDTTVTLGSAAEVALRDNPAYDGVLATPYLKVILFDANVPEFLSAPVPYSETRVRIWTNHPTEPDDIFIGLG